MTDIIADQGLSEILDRGEEVRFDSAIGRRPLSGLKRWLVAVTWLAIPSAIVAAAFSPTSAGIGVLVVFAAWCFYPLEPDKRVVLTDRRLLYWPAAGAPLQSHSFREIAGITRLGGEGTGAFILKRSGGHALSIGQLPGDVDFWHALPTDVQHRKSEKLRKKFIVVNLIFGGLFLLFTLPTLLGMILTPVHVWWVHCPVPEPSPEIVFWPLLLVVLPLSWGRGSIAAFGLRALVCRKWLSRSEARHFLAWQTMLLDQAGILRRLLQWVVVAWDWSLRRLYGPQTALD